MLQNHRIVDSVVDAYLRREHPTESPGQSPNAWLKRVGTLRTKGDERVNLFFNTLTELLTKISTEESIKAIESLPPSVTMLPEEALEAGKQFVNAQETIRNILNSRIDLPKTMFRLADPNSVLRPVRTKMLNVFHQGMEETTKAMKAYMDSKSFESES
jgi:hypothetical protein